MAEDKRCDDIVTGAAKAAYNRQGLLLDQCDGVVPQMLQGSDGLIQAIPTGNSFVHPISIFSRPDQQTDQERGMAYSPSDYSRFGTQRDQSVRNLHGR